MVHLKAAWWQILVKYWTEYLYQIRYMRLAFH